MFVTCRECYAISFDLLYKLEGIVGPLFLYTHNGTTEIQTEDGRIRFTFYGMNQVCVSVKRKPTETDVNQPFSRVEFNNLTKLERIINEFNVTDDDYNEDGLLQKIGFNMDVIR